MSKDRLEALWDIGPQIVGATPHAKFLGMKFVAVEIGKATLSLPYAEKLIGNTETKVMHGGAVTALLDQASGFAAMSARNDNLAVATLDLRIDYMRAAVPGKTVIAEAHAYKTTKHIVFVRAIAHDGDADDPVATAQASFITTGGMDKTRIDPDAAAPKATGKPAKGKSV